MINRSIGGNHRRYPAAWRGPPCFIPIITLLIGINDVWRHLTVLAPDSPPEYRENGKIPRSWAAAARYMLLPFMVLRPCDEPMYVMAMDRRLRGTQRRALRLSTFRPCLTRMKNEAPKSFGRHGHPHSKAMSYSKCALRSLKNRHKSRCFSAPALFYLRLWPISTSAFWARLQTAGARRL